MGVDSSAEMTAVFLDSSFWIALRGITDANHEAARQLAAVMAARRVNLLSTLLVFSEIHAYFCRMIKVREQIITDFWHRGVIQLEPVSYPDQQAALAILRQYEDKDFSFCDASSFAVMQRLKIRRAASFDHHFRQFPQIEVLDDPDELG
jgi:predicted nucleic acid-binding protein